MKALVLTVAILASQASPIPPQHFSYTDPAAGLYNMAVPLLAEGVHP